ncbi:MAG: Prophage endopeptidase tail [Firmicutes bacterium ADurb.Bin193]|nr:MAG: Prophage endopeptidase tail [Firmicutes bacterium ADurb.Bin193]
MYPVVYDKTCRSFDKMGLATLSSAKNIKIRRVVNGEYTLSFTLMQNDENRRYIKEENIVTADGQAFRIRSFENTRDSLGKLVLNVRCEHVSYDLNDIKHIPSMDGIVNVTPMEMFVTGFSDGETFFDGLFNGTCFTLLSSVEGSTDLFLYKTSPRAVLNKFLEDLDCEVVFDNWNVSLVKRCGGESGVQFCLGKNLRSIKRITDSSALVTRLYPYGEDYLDITSVNEGVPYVDSPLIGLYDYIHEGYEDFAGIYDPALLKQKALDRWSTEEKDGIDKPRVTYEIDIIELKKLADYSSFEEFSLGDTVRVRDEALGIDICTRILEYDYYPYEPQRSSVVLSNFKENIGGVFAELLKAKNLVTNVINGKGRINDAFIDSVRQTMQMKFSEAMTKKAVIHDYADVWVDDIDNPSEAIALVDGMFALANSKNPQGMWNWRTIGSGGRLVADEVLSSWVYAGEIHASQITAGTINTNSIKIKSNDGRLEINGNKLIMKAQGSSKENLVLSPSSGLSYTHKYDALGRPVKTSLFDISGAGIIYYEYQTSDPDETGTPSYLQYVNGVFAGTEGGGASDPIHFLIYLYSPVWADTNRYPRVIVTPAETLRFVRSDGGRINDLSDYKCTVSSVTQNSEGLIIDVESWKTYVYSISGGNPSYRTGSLKFNILAIMA